MYSFYRHNERTTTMEQWGDSIDTFFASTEEKYLGFGDLVQLTHISLKNVTEYAPMQLYKNMEFVDIIIKGSVGYQDSLGQVSSFPEETVRVLSAGTGIYQREFNSGDGIAEKIRLGFLPAILNQAAIKTKALFNLHEHKNSFVELVSPANVSSLTIGQQVAVLLGEFEANQHIGYSLHNNSVGFFVYVVKGKVAIQNAILSTGEAVGITDEEQTILHTSEPSILLLIEVELIEQLENS